MQIVLKRTWMNHKRGEILNINESIALRLVDWGTARAYDEKKDGKKSKPSKSIRKAPSDKMMARAPDEK